MDMYMDMNQNARISLEKELTSLSDIFRVDSTLWILSVTWVGFEEEVIRFDGTKPEAL
jgi:hypothetical protein